MNKIWRRAAGLLLLMVSAARAEQAACDKPSDSTVDKTRAAILRDVGERHIGAFGSCSSTGEQRVAAIMVNMPDAALEADATPAAVRSLLFGAKGSLNSYVREVSGGRAWLKGEVYGPVTLSRTYQCSDSVAARQAIVQQAITALDSQIDFRRVTRLIFIVPLLKDCADGMVESMGCHLRSSPGDGSFAASLTAVGSLQLPWILHFFRYALGIGTAHRFPDTEPLGPIGARLPLLEHDPWEITNSRFLSHFPSLAKFRLGWMPAEAVLTVTQPGTYTVAPLEYGSGSPRALRIQRGLTGDDWLWVEHRQSLGLDQNLPVRGSAGSFQGSDSFLGAEVRYETPLAPRSTILVPLGPSGLLMPGNRWADPYSDVSIETVSSTSSGLTVKIGFDSCATLPTTVTIHPSLSGTLPVPVTAPADCAVRVAAADAWITLLTPTSFSGNGSVLYFVPENLSKQARQGTISIGRRTLLVTQSGTSNSRPFVSSMSPEDGSSPAGTPQRFRFVFGDFDGASQIWEAGISFSRSSFLENSCQISYIPAFRHLSLITGEEQGTATAVLGTTSVLSNSQCSVNPQTATAVINGESLELTFDVTFDSRFAGVKKVRLSVRDSEGDQFAKNFGTWTVRPQGACSTSATTETPNFTRDAFQAGSFDIIASEEGCPWLVTGLPPWIKMLTTAGTGSAGLYFDLDQNRGAERRATISVAGTAITITQGAAPCAVSLAAGTTDFPAAGGRETFRTVANASACTWTLTSYPSWLVPDTTSGAGSATIGYTVTRNDGAARSGNLVLTDGANAPSDLFIRQAGAACSVSGTASQTSFPPAGGSATFEVVANLAACNWNITGLPNWVTAAASGSGTVSTPFAVAANSGGARSATVVIAGTAVILTQAAAVTPPASSAPLRLVPLPPCRVVDTRAGQGKTGAFGPPALPAGGSRTIPMLSSNCGLPASAKAYALNITVVPKEPLSYLTVWPSGASQPFVSTLNSFQGSVVANSAIAPAGAAGSIDVFATNAADLIIDLNGYFTDSAALPSALVFYPIAPCRAIDTRPGQGTSGAFGPPSFSASTRRTFPIPQSRCSIPSRAQAYSMNFTVVPVAGLSYLTAWPSGQNQPLVSTLNSFEGRVVANGAIVPAGAAGGVDLFVTDAADVVADINGYFAPDDGSGLFFYAVTPCRAGDTRSGQGASGLFGPPTLGASSVRTMALPQSRCPLPASAKAYSLNVTVAPPGPLSFLTAWPSGSTQPLVSTLNSFDGRVVANGALIPAGSGGSVSFFVTNPTDLIVDLNGFFDR